LEIWWRRLYSLQATADIALICSLVWKNKGNTQLAPDLEKEIKS
jgi:hypothetical protein